MGDFIINKQAQEEPKYCDYIQEKVDIAKQHNSTYQLDDEDRRIQALYDDQSLVTKDDIKSLDRILSQGDGKEYLVANKDVIFYAQQPVQGGDVILVYKDRYSTNEGIVQLPLRTINEDGVESTNQTRLVYTIPFSAAKVDEYIKKSGSKPITFRFYEGAVTSNRVPHIIPSVGNRDFFVEGTWQELLYGKEKKVLNSMISTLPQVRKELKKNNNNTQEDPEQTPVERPVINPNDTPVIVTQDTNKVVTDNKNSGDNTGSTTTTTTGTGANKKQVSKN